MSSREGELALQMRHHQHLKLVQAQQQHHAHAQLVTGLPMQGERRGEKRGCLCMRMHEMLSVQMLVLSIKSVL